MAYELHNKGPWYGKGSETDKYTHTNRTHTGKRKYIGNPTKSKIEWYRKFTKENVSRVKFGRRTETEQTKGAS